MPVHFRDFTLDESRRQLLKGAEPIHLSPKAFQLLSILIEQRPRAVSKKDLQQQLWPDTFVSDGNLASAVAELRSALGDDRRESRFIRTLYGFGYSFTAPTEKPNKQQDDRPQRPKRSMAAVLFGAFSAIALLSLRSASETAITTRPPIRTVAILPFDTSAADRADEHLGLGLADLLITRLSNVRHLVVRPTSAIRRYAGGRVDWRDAGRKLQVDAVVEGSIRTSPDRVRVTVQLLNTRDQKPVWADQFDHKRGDLFAIEDAISGRVADALTMQLTPSERALLSKRYTADPEAYSLYIQARYQQEQTIRQGHLDMSEAIDLAKKAVQKDPGYALAWAVLGEMYAGSGAFDQLPPQPAFQNAKAAIEKALQLDDELSEAHSAAAVIKMYSDLDYAGAEREFIRALQLNPHNTIALMHYGRLVQCLGRFDEAIALRKRQIEIDPLNPGAQSFLAAAYLTARQDELGIQQCRLVLRMDPNFSTVHAHLARIYTLRGEYDKAITEAREAMRTDKDRAQGLGLLGYALAMAGRTAEANGILQQLEKEQKAHPFDLAIVHMGLRHRDDVFRLLEKAVDDRTYVLRLKTEPIFAPLRNEPRFRALLQRAGFGG